MAGKQAKVLTDAQVRAVLNFLSTTRNPARNRVMFLLSLKAGLRAAEIAGLTWSMVTDAQGEVAHAIALNDAISKRGRGRTIPMNRELRQALVDLRDERDGVGKVRAAAPVVYSERGSGMSAKAVALWFLDLYRRLGFEGCSSHSGRRTFITKAAKAVVAAGGSLRDVQELAGHSSLQTTQGYIQGDTDAKRRLVDMI